MICSVAAFWPGANWMVTGKTVSGCALAAMAVNESDNASKRTAGQRRVANADPRIQSPQLRAVPTECSLRAIAPSSTKRVLVSTAVRHAKR